MNQDIVLILRVETPEDEILHEEVVESEGYYGEHMLAAMGNCTSKMWCDGTTNIYIYGPGEQLLANLRGGGPAHLVDEFFEQENVSEETERMAKMAINLWSAVVH